jgi:hypothetical protein
VRNLLLAFVVIAAVGCKKSDCKKMAEKMTECGVSYGPLLENSKGQVMSQLEGHCDAATESGDDAMKARAACVIAADNCDQVKACF